jgi:RNA polymerase primary sigma factor
MSQLPISLEKPIGEEEESELGDFVQDETAESPFDSTSVHLRREDIDKALESLPDRERRVIELRFGLGGESPHTPGEAAKVLGVKPHQVRRAEDRALRVLGALPGLRQAA